MTKIPFKAPLDAVDALRDVPPPDGVAALRAGLSCGQLGREHTRALLTASSFARLMREIEHWRCACGHPAFGERARTVHPPATPAEPRSPR